MMPCFPVLLCACAASGNAPVNPPLQDKNAKTRVFQETLLDKAVLNVAAAQGMSDTVGFARLESTSSCGFESLQEVRTTRAQELYYELMYNADPDDAGTQ